MAVRLVRWVGDEPSTFITHTLVVLLVLALSLPSRARVEAKAILLPSGEMEGNTFAAFVNWVNGVGWRGMVVGSTAQILGIPNASPTRAALML